MRQAIAAPAVESLLAEFAKVEVDVPADLEERVRHHWAKHPKSSWDEALAAGAVKDAKRKRRR